MLVTYSSCVVFGFLQDLGMFGRGDMEKLLMYHS